MQQLCPEGRVLDVGCFDGGFFDHVGPGVDRYGVEIHDVAAANATDKRGVQIVAASYTELAGLGASFDAVVSFDVIEHVHEPREFLTALAAVVRPGGSVIVGTGNADAPTWRLMGSRYWYSWYPEHISFVSPRWFAQAAPASGLRAGAGGPVLPLPGRAQLHPRGRDERRVPGGAAAVRLAAPEAGP